MFRTSRRVICYLAGAALAATLLLTPAAAVAATPDYEQPPISYSTTRPSDQAAKLMAALDAGAVTLAHDGERGYLDALLRELKIPPSSQTLVFSKTSFQAKNICARN